VSELGAHPDAAVHLLHELSADVQPEPRPADAAREVRVDPVELLEDPLELAGRDAEALVLHLEADPRPRALAPDLDPAAVRRVLDGVLDEVEQPLLHPPGVPDGTRHARLALELDHEARREMEPGRLDDL